LHKTTKLTINYHGKEEAVGSIPVWSLIITGNVQFSNTWKLCVFLIHGKMRVNWKCMVGSIAW